MLERDVLGGRVALLARRAAAEAAARLGRARVALRRDPARWLLARLGEIGDARGRLDALLALGYLVVVGSFVGFTAYVWLLRVAPISLVSTYAYVNPIVAVALGWLLLGEEITVQMVVAGAAVLVSRRDDPARERDRASSRDAGCSRGAAIAAAGRDRAERRARAQPPMYDISTLRSATGLLRAELGVAVGATLPDRADRLLELVVARVRSAGSRAGRGRGRAKRQV